MVPTASRPVGERRRRSLRCDRRRGRARPRRRTSSRSSPSERRAPTAASSSTRSQRIEAFADAVAELRAEVESQRGDAGCRERIEQRGRPRGRGRLPPYCGCGWQTTAPATHGVGHCEIGRQRGPSSDVEPERAVGDARRIGHGIRRYPCVDGGRRRQAPDQDAQRPCARTHRPRRRASASRPAGS